MHYYQAPYVGSADTNPISFSKINKIAGNMVIIHRNEKQVLNSVRKAFRRHEAFTAKEWEKYTSNMMNMYQTALEWFINNEPNVLYKEFEELEDKYVLMDIFRHCIPIAQPDWDYIDYYNRMRITVKSPLGMRNGIMSTLKYEGERDPEYDIEKFKRKHITEYDPETFKKTFTENMDLKEYEPVEPSRIVQMESPGLMGPRLH